MIQFKTKLSSDRGKGENNTFLREIH